ncbi:S8 family peptidase [Bacillus toyonensis]|uniref:S8 family peptidase n=1 Tax=Bacillus toyonensis TaxID=155322 RepID=UPI0015CF5DC3|nr:S8 family serine peptidase [Bacillus toyonensis]
MKCKKLTTKIAILDTGIDPNHPDLIEKIIDPINVTSDNPNDYIDKRGHGTFVAGVAAATTNNRIGIASASYNTAYIVPIKVIKDNNIVLAMDVIKGILYAIEKKVDVINMSFFTDDPRGYSEALQLVIEQAWNQNIILVAGVGNDGTTAPFYPAANNFVLGVSATDQTNQLSVFSNWGINIGITAPGTDILSTIPTYFPDVDGKTAYFVLSGTSFSTPFVTGVAAMLRAIKPTATNQEIIQSIQRSSKNLNIIHKEWGSFYGYGLLDASEAVNELLSPKVASNKDLGSFYGQIRKDDKPILNITLYVVNNNTNSIVRIYTPPIYNFPGTTTSKSDGMFRMINLPKGNYSIYANDVDPKFLLATVDIVPGADVYVKLVLPDPSESITSVLKNSE